MADNYRFEIIHDSRNKLNAFVDLLNERRESVGYLIEKNSLIIFKYRDSRMKEFPFPYTQEMICDFIWEWLKNVKYEEEPYHDGDNKKGYRISTFEEDSIWYCPGGYHSASMKIEPVWCMYGK